MPFVEDPDDRITVPEVPVGPELAVRRPRLPEVFVVLLPVVMAT